MKILEICEFSSGVCGVWQRVKQESIELSKKGHNVHVFSSNLEKGTEKRVENKQVLENIEINRFDHKTSFFDKLITKNVTYFDFTEELINLNPDLVITHTIHPHSFRALDICLEKKIPCFLVTHSPFDVKRNFFLSILTSLFYQYHSLRDSFNKFSKIVSISQWELPHLKKLGIIDEKIIYVPNGIPDKFFRQDLLEIKNKKILFLGRVAPIKNLEILIKSFNEIKKENIFLEIVGPIEKGYEKIKENTSNKIKFTGPIYELDDKIKKLQEADLFVLPSKREAMPQSLIEAMALGKIVISSNTSGGNEIIKDGHNGFIFDKKSHSNLTSVLNNILNNINIQKLKQIQLNARKTSEKFKWKKIISKLEEEIKKIK